MLGWLAAVALSVQSPPPHECAPTTAAPVAVAQIGADVEGFIGRCVTVEGLFARTTLYGRVADVYLSNRYRLDGNPDPTIVRRGRIGLYSPNNELRQRSVPREGAEQIRVTGTVDTCERKRKRAEEAASARGEPAVIMMTGYCHYYSGAVIDVTSYAIDPDKRYERLTAERARKEVGDVVPMPDDWPFRDELQATATAFLSALRSGNRQRMMELHDITAPLNDFDEEVLALVLQQPQSPFAQLRSGRELPVRLYVQRVEAERLRQRGEEPDLANGMACFCRTTDCTGRWPIGSNDMDNWQTRPYACVRMWRQDWPGGKLIVDTAPGRNGFLKEPAQTAYRSR